MARILTLTMNPALDAFTSVPRVEPAHKLRCDAAQYHPGGGGINVARVLHRLGTDALALFPVGGLTGQRLCRLLEQEQVPARCLPIAGDTRESFTAHDRASSQDYRFVLPGPRLAEAEWQGCLDAIATAEPVPAYLVASGSLPPGVPEDFYADAARAASRRGMRVVVDASGPALQAALDQGVFLIKPSLRELAGLTGLALDSQAAQRRACEHIIQKGQAGMVALSLGDQGAMLVTGGQAWCSPALPVPVQSTVGAGDSFLAGLLWALDQGRDPAQALAHGMAAGAAALLSDGTALCTPEDLRRLLPQVRVQAL